MPALRFDEELRAKFDLAAGATELCDDDGQPVAYVLSAEQYRRLVFDAIASKHSDEQAERSWQSYLQGGGVSTQDAWERVERQLAAREGAA